MPPIGAYGRRHSITKNNKEHKSITKNIKARYIGTFCPMLKYYRRIAIASSLGLG
jgi:hypothetical protein